MRFSAGERGRAGAHEDVHVLVEAIVGDEVVGHLDAVRLHGVHCGVRGSRVSRGLIRVEEAGGCAPRLKAYAPTSSVASDEREHEVSG